MTPPLRRGEFVIWQPSERRCHKLLDGKPCGAPTLVRTWESHDGAYEDYQYRCENGHTWWIDGIDA